MHLKLDSAGGIDDGDVARDLGQDSADIVVLSAADSDLAAFAAAHATLPAEFPTLQLTNLLALGHPASVDLYVERTLSKAKIVLLRMLGGASYWPHGIDSLRADARARGALFACIPGEMRWDADLASRGTLDADTTHPFWRYCSEGGIDNAQLALRYAAHLIGYGERPPVARPMPAAGFWPHAPVDNGRPRALIVFYRALVAGDDTAPIAALRDALDARGLDTTCVFVTSLKDAQCQAFLRTAMSVSPPDIILNATAFATATATNAGVLAGCDAPILQVALAGSSRAAWDSSTRGLTPRDLAMHVVLPEVDGRIFANVIAFKERGDDESGFAPVRYKPVQDRIDAAADLAAAWVRLRRAKPSQRRVAILLANYPNRDGRLGNGVGLDTPESLIGVLAAMRSEGYAIDGVPDDAAAMMQMLQDGPTNALQGRAGRIGGVAWPLADYRNAFATLPSATQRAVIARWAMQPAIRIWMATPCVLRCIASATSSSACSQRAATTSIRRRPITIQTLRRRIIISRPISGCAALSIRMPSCISASTAISNGCRARAPGYPPHVFPMPS